MLLYTEFRPQQFVNERECVCCGGGGGGGGGEGGTGDY